MHPDPICRKKEVYLVNNDKKQRNYHVKVTCALIKQTRRATQCKISETFYIKSWRETILDKLSLVGI